MKIEISEESTHSLMRDILIEDYCGLRDSIYDLVNRGVEEGKLGDHLVEDYRFNQRILEGLKIVLEYYSVEELNSLLDKMKVTIH